MGVWWLISLRSFEEVQVLFDVCATFGLNGSNCWTTEPLTMVVWPLRWTSSRLCFQVWRNSWLFRRMAFSKGWANRAPKWYIPCFYWWSRAASEFADFWMCYPNETIFAWSACLNFKAKSTMLPKTPKSAEVMCLIQLLSFHLFSFFGTATTTNHQPPTTNHQPPTTNHQPPQPSSKILTIGARTHCWLGEWKGGSAQWKDWRGEAAQKDFFLGQVYSCSKAVFFFGGGVRKIRNTNRRTTRKLRFASTWIWVKRTGLMNLGVIHGI